MAGRILSHCYPKKPLARSIEYCSRTRCSAKSETGLEVLEVSLVHVDGLMDETDSLRLGAGGA